MITKFKLFEGYLEYSGLNSYWSDGKTTTIYFKDVLKYLDEEKVSIKLIDPKKIEHLLIKTKRDPKRVEESDLQYPLIITMKNGKYDSLLDGQHRLVKAINNNIDKIKIRLLNIDLAPDNFKKVFN